MPHLIGIDMGAQTDLEHCLGYDPKHVLQREGFNCGTAIVGVAMDHLRISSTMARQTALNTSVLSCSGVGSGLDHSAMPASLIFCVGSRMASIAARAASSYTPRVTGQLWRRPI